jgi:hypothetical protein
MVGKISTYVDNIVHFYFIPWSAKRCDSSRVSHWIPPPTGTVCVNVDAAIFAAERHMRWGVVVRDHDGTLKLACKEGIDDIITPEVAEATAITRALLVTRNHGFQDIVLTSDSLSIIQRICSSESDRLEVELL